MSLLGRLKRAARRVLPHRPEYYRRRLLGRASERALADALGRVGVRPGAVVFVHTALSQLGYYPPGPAGFIRLLRDLVGPEGTVAMPSFPTDDAMQDYAAGDPLFDVRSTPSRSGLVTEVFRTTPGVVRSLHPTHPVCAVGARAAELTAGHERSPTPCGPDTPFGRLAGLNAVVLRVGTGSTTLYHHVQELADAPNLFLPDTATLRCVDATGNAAAVETRVYRKGLPNILFLGEDAGDQRLSAHPSNFPLLHPGGREEALRRDASRRVVLDRLLAIRREFEAKGWSRRAAVGACPIDAFEVAPYVAYGVAEERRLIAEFRHRYDPADLARRLAAGEYPSRN